MLGFVRERAGNALPGIMPSNTYPTRDGKYVIIGANNDSDLQAPDDGDRDASDLANDPTLATTPAACRAPRNSTR